ncbi:MAG TPA: DoxX family protein [Polyangiaceae bacterium]
MNAALWSIEGSLALLFLAAGLPKLLQPRERLEARMRWTRHASGGPVKLLGLAEVLGAAGLVLPRALGIATYLTPLAAACLFVLMLGAVGTKLRSDESPALPLGAAIGCALVALCRLSAG